MSEEVSIPKGDFYLFSKLPMSANPGIACKSEVVHFPASDNFNFTQQITRSDYANVPVGDFEFKWKGKPKQSDELNFVLRRTEGGKLIPIPVKTVVEFRVSNEKDARKVFIEQTEANKRLGEKSAVELEPTNF